MLYFHYTITVIAQEILLLTISFATITVTVRRLLLLNWVQIISKA